MTSLHSLTRLAPPPGSPRPTDWDAVESLLRRPLPTDYKQLVDIYGPGSFCGFLHLYTPRGNREAVDLTGPMPARLRGQLVKDRDSGTYPMPHRPEDLFAFGVTHDGSLTSFLVARARTRTRTRTRTRSGRFAHQHDGHPGMGPVPGLRRTRPGTCPRRHHPGVATAVVTKRWGPGASGTPPPYGAVVVSVQGASTKPRSISFFQCAPTVSAAVPADTGRVKRASHTPSSGPITDTSYRPPAST